jgi:hypothetical protein
MASLRSRKTFIILGLVLLLGAAAAGLAIVHARSSAKPSASTTHHAPDTAMSDTPLFSFDASRAADWKQGPGNNTSMAIFSKTPGCFASVEMKIGAVNEAQALSKVTASFSEQGYGIKTLSPVSTTFSVSGNASGIPYTLHPYALSGVAAGGYKTQAVGYAGLTGRYVSIQAYCSNDTTLPQIAAALSAIVLKAD